MRSSVLALALPLVAALPSFHPTIGPAAGGGLEKRWKLNREKASNTEVTPADVAMYRKMGWTEAQILQLDPEAPVGTQLERPTQAPSLPQTLGGDSRNRDPGDLVTNRVGGGDLDNQNNNAWPPLQITQPKVEEVDNTRSRDGTAGGEDAASTPSTTGQGDNWLDIANEIRQSLPISRQAPKKLSLLEADPELEAAAKERSAESVGKNKEQLTHTPQGKLRGSEVMHFGQVSEFREVFWGFLCEMPGELGIQEQCKSVKNTRSDGEKGHAKAVTEGSFSRIGCGHAPSDYNGGQWTCQLK
ncbi:cysteine-rich secretory protein family protein [Hirsutella rhossiliensis]|uniref:Cysteine-rich secretory protein family domain-containing protein n=1 Tax=Hirsutella rhossiliensis TaxID=111463 RepID=A0A9P8SDY2_9HYPO|nr:cysteine-rich secretory protein family domain-containing protein [Hirsutella rhossiliensis]KAH0958429.1 cysteine-rich secretory protein family domain-containing protein [Hirsutella rhossiliensis]